MQNQNENAGGRQELKHGAEVVQLGELLGIYSAPERDPRFHAVTLVVATTVSEPGKSGVNPVEITEVKLFRETELPTDITQGMEDMIENVRSKKVVWE